MTAVELLGGLAAGGAIGVVVALILDGVLALALCLWSVVLEEWAKWRRERAR